MIEVPSQFIKHSGPLGTGEHRISFDVQPEYASQLYQALAEWTKNPNGILYFKSMSKPETPKDKWTRYNKKIHSLLDEIDEQKEQLPGTTKHIVKDSLIKESKIKESLKELTEENQLEVINRLERIINEDE